jgi:hypothetical protein
LPVVDNVASDYQDSVRFIAVAGRSDYDATADRASQLFSNLDWGLDESIWDLYGVPGQPASVLITGNDIVVDGWFGEVGEDALRASLDQLVAYGV